uniref:DNA 3'-5' helicase n=1 Tax=Sander lucioperca TaxID=283035 RepID=A0A8C9YH23_SANLU
VPSRPYCKLTALKSFLKKEDVFEVLPTGYGKSLIYQLALLVIKRMIVVSPLIALLEDQLKEATKFGLKMFYLIQPLYPDIHVKGRDKQCRKLKENGPRMSPVIIYCQELGEDLLASLGGDGACKVVVATTALGMGLNFPNISHVIMYGSPEDVEAVVQEVGRAGRDGSPSHTIIYRVKQDIRMDKVVKTLLKKGTTSCLRKTLYSHFKHHTESVLPGHLCCSYCNSFCLCSSAGCDMATPEYELSQQDVHATVKIREVT